MHVLAQYCVIIVCTQYGYWPSIVYTVYLISSRYSADTMLQYRLYIGRMLFAHSMDIGAVSYTMHLISSRYSADTMLQYRLYIGRLLFAHSMDIGAVSYTIHLISSRYSADTMLPDVVCSQYRYWRGIVYMPLISSQYSADTMPQYRLYIDLMSFTHSVDIGAVSYVRCI